MDTQEREDAIRALIGLTGFQVRGVRLEDGPRREVIKVIYLEDERGSHYCGECGQAQLEVAFQEVEPRRWRDCSLGDYPTYIEIQPWRVRCCDGTRVEQFPWEAAGHRMTRRFFERVAALATRMPISHVARMAGLAWGTVRRIDEEAIRLALGDERPDFSKVRWIGIDEVSRTGGHVYFTIITDLDTDRVIWIGDGRGADGADGFFDELGEKGRKRIQGVVSDLGYVSTIEKWIPYATHILDRFHVVKWLNDAVSDLRRRIFGGAPKEAIGRALKAKKWMLLRAREKLPHADKLLLRRLLDANHPLFVAYVLKEQLRAILRHPWRYIGSLVKNIYAWIDAVAESEITELQKVAKRIEKHIERLVEGFHAPVKLGFVEAVNGKIAKLRRDCRGLRDNAYFKLKIFQRCSLPDNPWAEITL